VADPRHGLVAEIPHLINEPLMRTATRQTIAHMLSRFAHVLLVATSLAPISLIYGISKAGASSRVCGVYVGLAAVLTAMCLGLLYYAARNGSVESILVARSKCVDKDAVTFLVAYALPLIVATDRAQNLVALVGFVAVVFVVLVRMQVAQANPVLGAFGYHFFEVSPASGETALLVTRGRGAPGSTRVVRLSDLIWLELPK